MKKLLSLIAFVTIFTTISCGQTSKKTIKSPSTGLVKARTSAEWKKVLSANQYYIMVEKGTEPPFKNAYFNNHQKGVYVSAATGEPLFSSADKFESGTGWPSFTKPINSNAITIVTDADGMRDEVIEKKTGLHLGHVFDDGPEDKGGKRYCMNSGALKFIKK